MVGWTMSSSWLKRVLVFILFWFFYSQLQVETREHILNYSMQNKMHQEVLPHHVHIGLPDVGYLIRLKSNFSTIIWWLWALCKPNWRQRLWFHDLHFLITNSREVKVVLKHDEAKSFLSFFYFFSFLSILSSMLTPFRLEIGVCISQPCVTTINPSEQVGLRYNTFT